jgi:hypothetical protein
MNLPLEFCLIRPGNFRNSINGHHTLQNVKRAFIIKSLLYCTGVKLGVA